MIFEQMYTDDLERLHTNIVKAARAIKIYTESGENSATFALRCEEYARLFLMEIAIFDEIAKSARKASNCTAPPREPPYKGQQV